MPRVDRDRPAQQVLDRAQGVAFIGVAEGKRVSVRPCAAAGTDNREWPRMPGRAGTGACPYRDGGGILPACSSGRHGRRCRPALRARPYSGTLGGNAETLKGDGHGPSNVARPLPLPPEPRQERRKDRRSKPRSPRALYRRPPPPVEANFPPHTGQARGDAYSTALNDSDLMILSPSQSAPHCGAMRCRGRVPEQLRALNAFPPAADHRSPITDH